MRGKMFILLCITTFLCINQINSEEDVNFDIKDTNINERRVEKRQIPWNSYLPQSLINPGFLANSQESWRYYPPCRTYPPYIPYSPPPLPPSTLPSSSKDDPNDILDRMSGGRGRTPPKEEPSRCVWAVVACCSPGSRDIRYSCFELLGCPGAFWDVNPCEDKVVMAAANSALDFYSDMNNGTSTTPSS